MLHGYSHRCADFERRIDWSRDAELSAALLVAEGLIGSNNRWLATSPLNQGLLPVVEW